LVFLANLIYCGFSLLGYDTLSLVGWFLMFSRNLDCLTIEDVGTTLLSSVGYHSPGTASVGYHSPGTASHLRRPESAATML
jgi:hypothetical protein